MCAMAGRSQGRERECCGISVWHNATHHLRMERPFFPSHAPTMCCDCDGCSQRERVRCLAVKGFLRRTREDDIYISGTSTASTDARAPELLALDIAPRHLDVRKEADVLLTVHLRAADGIVDVSESEMEIVPSQVRAPVWAVGACVGIGQLVPVWDVRPRDSLSSGAWDSPHCPLPAGTPVVSTPCWCLTLGAGYFPNAHGRRAPSNVFALGSSHQWVSRGRLLSAVSSRCCLL